MALATESDSRNRSLPQHGRGRDSAQVSITVRPSCPGMAQMALATESDSRNRSLPQHGRGRDSAQVSITVRPGTMRKTVLGISREKPCENRRELRLDFNEKFNGRNSILMTPRAR